ncbi:MAG: PD-(D/E)XK nuclease family protein [Betaproteobacteria bacterium]|nr:PD-(D/E)XK nuclease family protein [Betaproteobacteria bacterium]
MLDTFAKCPAQAKRLYIDKDVKRESGPEAEEGIRIHQMLETALLEGAPLPEPYAVWSSYVEPLRRDYDELHAEKRLALDKDFNPADDGMLVGEVDALIIKGDRAVILDWKTGKPRDNVLQLQIYALLVLKHFPQVQAGAACNVYLRHGTMGEAFHFERSKIADLVHAVGAKIFLFGNAVSYNRWPEKPSGLCSYCPVKGCKYWKERT